MKSRRIERYRWPRPKGVDVDGPFLAPSAVAEPLFEPSDAQREQLRARLESMPLSVAALAAFTRRYGVLGVRDPDEQADHPEPWRLERLDRLRFGVLEYRLGVALHAALTGPARKRSSRLSPLLIGPPALRGRTRDERAELEAVWDLEGWRFRLPVPDGLAVDPFRHPRPVLFARRQRRSAPLTSILPGDPVHHDSEGEAARELLERLLLRRCETWTRWDFEGKPGRRRRVLFVGSALGCAWQGLADAYAAGRAFHCVVCGSPFTGSLRQKGGEEPLYCGGPSGACSRRIKRRRAQARKLRGEGRSVRQVARAMDATERDVRSWTEG